LRPSGPLLGERAAGQQGREAPSRRTRSGSGQAAPAHGQVLLRL